MQKIVGLWIDHRQAIIVIISEKGEEVKLIESNVEKQFGHSGGSRSKALFKLQQISTNEMPISAFQEHLNIYYDEIISYIYDAAYILIFGPGEAKGELKKRIERHKSNKSIIIIETADKMTEYEIVEKVRHHFFKSSSIKEHFLNKLGKNIQPL